MEEDLGKETGGWRGKGGKSSGAGGETIIKKTCGGMAESI